jgi:hypothetical protein
MDILQEQDFTNVHVELAMNGLVIYGGEKAA